MFTIDIKINVTSFNITGYIKFSFDIQIAKENIVRFLVIIYIKEEKLIQI